MKIRQLLSALLQRAKDRVSWTLLRVAAWIDNGFCQKAIIFVGQRSPEELRGFVMERANEISCGIFIKMMDREGIAHCCLCPQRFGLKKVGRLYACLNHSEEVKAKAA